MPFLAAIPIGVAALIGGGAAAAGSIASGAIGAGAAGQAASTQAGAANYAANLQYQAAQNALQFQQQVYGNQQQQIQPYLQSGYGGLATLDTLLGIPPYQGGAQQGTSAPGWPGAVGGGYSAAPGMTSVPAGGPIAPGLPVRGGPIMGSQGPIAPGLSFNGAPIAGQGGARLQMGPQGNALPVTGPGLNRGGIAAGAGAGATFANAPLAPSPTAAGAGRSANIQPGFLAQTWNQPFVPPTDVTQQNDPGYQFRLSQGLQALQNSAAAGGGLLTGATAKDINNYAQNYASNEYGNVYNRALGQYQQAYNIFNQNQANLFNRYASLAGLGQTAVQQLNTAGGQAAGNVGNILLGSSQNIGQAAQQAGAATASGYVGGANAIGGAIGGATSGLSSGLLLSSLLGGGQNNTFLNAGYNPADVLYP